MNENTITLVNARNKSEDFLDKVESRKGGSGYNKMKMYMKDEDIRAFNREMASISFASNSIYKRNVSELFYDEISIKNMLTGYFDSCLSRDIMPTVASLCVFIGCTKAELYKYMNDTNCPSAKLLKKSVMLCHSFAEMGVLNGVIDSRTFSFLAKNYYNMSDDTNLKITAGVSSGNDMINNVETASAIREQIMLEHKED